MSDKSGSEERLLRAREHAQRALDELGLAQRALSVPGGGGGPEHEGGHPEARKVEGKLEAARSVVEGTLDELDLLSESKG